MVPKPEVSGYNLHSGEDIMDTTTFQSPYSETFEQIMSTMKELTEKHNQNMLEWEKAKEQRNEEWEQRMRGWEEIKKRQEETDKQLAINTKLVGKLSNSFGELAEHLVAPNIVEKFKAIGFKVEKLCKNVKIYTPDLTRIIAEIDIFIENGDTAIVVEVKSKLRENHLKEFIIKMEKFRKYSDRKQDSRKFIGAIAAAILDEKQRQEILNEGIYVLEQTGDTMKITAPEGFIPREW